MDDRLIRRTCYLVESAFYESSNYSAGEPGDAVPLPEREVSSLPSLVSLPWPQSTQERHLNRYPAND